VLHVDPLLGELDGLVAVHLGDQFGSVERVVDRTLAGDWVMKPGWMVAHDFDPRVAMPYRYSERSVRSMASWMKSTNRSGDLVIPRWSK
jgi:hypothetical protein